MSPKWHIDTRNPTSAPLFRYTDKVKSWIQEVYELTGALVHPSLAEVFIDHLQQSEEPIDTCPIPLD